MILAAAIGLSATAAAADCDYHKVNAAVDVDHSMTTASVTTDEQKAADVALLKKAQRLPEDAAATE